MALIKAINYDPAAMVTKSLGSLMSMTALDTTNLRMTFTAPDSGNVLVRLRAALDTGSWVPRVFLGIMENGAVRMRLAPSGPGNWYVSGGATIIGIESVFVQTGLTPGAEYIWDAAYAVEGSNASASLRYGGPNDTTAANAGGAFVFEIWEA